MQINIDAENKLIFMRKWQLVSSRQDEDSGQCSVSYAIG